MSPNYKAADPAEAFVVFLHSILAEGEKDEEQQGARRYRPPHEKCKL
jgi:hypothetical protein